MGPCKHYMVRTTFIDYNKLSDAGRKTYTPIREAICNHPNIDQVIWTNNRRKINCEGDDNKCLLSNAQKQLS